MSVKIDQALIARFMAGNHGLQVAHENLPFKPQQGTAYVELRVLPNDITPLSLSGSDETDGVFRVLLNWPRDGGAIPAKQKADEILARFPVGQRVDYDGQRVHVTATQRANGVAEDGWFRLVLSITYRAFTERAA